MDVTSLATGLVVEDPSLASFLAPPSSGDDGRERQHLLRGKSPGTTRVKLHDQANPSPHPNPHLNPNPDPNLNPNPKP